MHEETSTAGVLNSMRTIRAVGRTSNYVQRGSSEDPVSEQCCTEHCSLIRVTGSRVEDILTQFTPFLHFAVTSDVSNGSELKSA